MKGSDGICSRQGRQRRRGAPLTVMENGERWFHTKEQMAFLERWVYDGR